MRSVCVNISPKSRNTVLMSWHDSSDSNGVESLRDDVSTPARLDELRELLLELRGCHRVFRIARPDSRSRR